MGNCTGYCTSCKEDQRYDNSQVRNSIKEKDFINVTPLLIDEILIKKHQIDNYSRRSVQSYVSIIRSFLRYAE